MIRFLALSFFIFSSVVNAGDYYTNQVDTYDPATGLYYKAVLNREDRGFMSKGSSDAVVNIAISNPATKSVALLFKEPLQGSITSVVFETGYKDGGIEFYGANSPYVKNNLGIPNRSPRNRLLVAVRDVKKEETALFVSEKDGNNLKKLIVFPERDNWHIDVRNSKLRVVHQLGNTIEIESIEW